MVPKFNMCTGSSLFCWFAITKWHVCRPLVQSHEQLMHLMKSSVCCVQFTCVTQLGSRCGICWYRVHILLLQLCASHGERPVAKACISWIQFKGKSGQAINLRNLGTIYLTCICCCTLASAVAHWANLLESCSFSSFSLQVNNSFRTPGMTLVMTNTCLPGLVKETH